MRHMNKAEAVREWKGCYLPDVKRQYERDGRPDWPARCELWNAFTDALCKAGNITLAQYNTWSAPPECGR